MLRTVIFLFTALASAAPHAVAGDWAADNIPASRTEFIARDSDTPASGDADQATAAFGLKTLFSAFERPRPAIGLSPPIVAGSLPNAVQTARAGSGLSQADKPRIVFDSYPSRVTAEIAQTHLAGAPVGTARDAFALRTGPLLSGAFDRSTNTEDVRRSDILVKATSPLSGDAPLGITQWDMVARYQILDEGTSRAEVPQFEGGLRFKPTREAAIVVSAGAAEARGWVYPVANTRLSYRPSPRWGAELSAEHDAVRSVAALANRVEYSSTSLGADVKFLNTTFAGALFRQWFSDDNERDGWVARVTLPSFVPMPGGPTTALQLYSRRFEGNRGDVVGYFSPERYHQEKLNLIMSGSLSPRWMLRIGAGVGEESIEGVRSPTLDTDLKLSGQLSRSARLDLSLRHGDSVPFSSPGLGYSQTSASLGLAFLLDR